MEICSFGSLPIGTEFTIHNRKHIKTAPNYVFLPGVPPQMIYAVNTLCVDEGFLIFVKDETLVSVNSKPD